MPGSVGDAIPREGAHPFPVAATALSTGCSTYRAGPRSATSTAPCARRPLIAATSARVPASAGLREVRCETLCWDHRASAEEWWSGPAAGVAFIGQLLLSQREEIRAEVKRHFDVLSQEFLGEHGRLVLPHAALLASACR